MAAMKLYYFPFPGRAEVAKILLTGGKVDFEHVKVARPEWMAFKPNTPFGQMPVLEVNGTMIAQTKAIDVYCAKISGFYPEDPLDAAKADMVSLQAEDIFQLFTPTFSIADAEEKIQKRQELVAGPIKEKLSALDKLLEGKEFVAGSKLSHGDIALFASMSGLRSGWLDGVPATILDDYPNLKRLRNKVAQVDFIKPLYENETAAPASGYKPDDA